MKKHLTSSTPIDTAGRRPTWAEIDLGALAANFREVRAAARRQRGPDFSMMSVVKADAYGHGAVRCARALASAGSDWFAVALPEEGVELREAGIKQPILVLGGFWEGQLGACLKHDLVPVIYRLDMAEALDRLARESGRAASAHVEVDTGMNRLGMRDENVAEFADALAKFSHVRVEGLMTHFAAADEPARDDFTKRQIARFGDARRTFVARGFELKYTHHSNSAGTLTLPRGAHVNLVRPGGVLYGLWRDVLPPTPESEAFARRLCAVLAWRTRVTLLKRVAAGETLGYGCTFETNRESLIATVPVGYHDGYPRSLSNRGHVIVRGRPAPIVGRVSMDVTIVDVTDVSGVQLGDVVTLIGRDGDEELSAEAVAADAGTISYEITCGVGARVKRYYLSD